MYSYAYDPATGGIILRDLPLAFSKEPRPVWAQEMDLLGFNSRWKYDSNESVPYMWAEGSKYYYRGQLIAQLRGGNLYEKPTVTFFDVNWDESRETSSGQGVLFSDAEMSSCVFKEQILKPIDMGAMLAANSQLLEVLVADTIQKILDAYERYQSIVDIFHVAYSGGKDSIVLLDLVKSALPANSFVVLFADTGMEFPDTLAAVRQDERKCRNEGISFERTKAQCTPEASWRKFAPPAKVARWCCCVHKSTPQTLTLRRLSGKPNYKGLDFVGVRRAESLSRSEYTYDNYSKKQKGQYSFNPLLEWNSAEIWLYIFSRNLTINAGYKKGNSRAGCLLCPMTGNLANYFRWANYTDKVERFAKIVRNSYDVPEKDADTTVEEQKKLKLSYLVGGGWQLRRNGRSLAKNKSHIIECERNGTLVFELVKPLSDWRQWFKTIGDVFLLGNSLTLMTPKETFEVQFEKTALGFKITVDPHTVKSSPKFITSLRAVLRKTAHCIACQTCEITCPYGAISFHEGEVRIENCRQCHDCYDIPGNCLAYKSLHFPPGTGAHKMVKRSLNTFADHAPKTEWLRSFFALKQRFYTEHSLGSDMFDFFRRFLRDAGLNGRNTFTEFAEFISRLGWDSENALGLILTNLVYTNPQMAWYTNFMDLEHRYAREELVGALKELGISDKDAASIVKAFKRLAATPLGTVLNWGRVEKKGKEEYLVRTAPKWGSPLVLLYSLFKFAEAMGGEYRAFNLGQLADPTAERQAVSPLRLWGATPAQLKAPLLGLNARYPEYIQVSFTHDLDSINLGPQSSAQVLELIQEV